MTDHHSYLGGNPTQWASRSHIHERRNIVQPDPYGAQKARQICEVFVRFPSLSLIIEAILSPSAKEDTQNCRKRNDYSDALQSEPSNVPDTEWSTSARSQTFVC